MTPEYESKSSVLRVTKYEGPSYFLYYSGSKVWKQVQFLHGDSKTLE